MSDNLPIDTGGAKGIVPLRTTEDSGGNHVQHIETEGVEAYSSSGTRYRARVTKQGELATTSAERENNVNVALRRSDVTTTAWAVLVDLSDTTNFPHAGTSQINLSSLRVIVDKTSDSQGAVSVGVITRVDGTNADVTFFASLRFFNSTETLLQRLDNWSPSQFRCGVSTGDLTQAISNIKDFSVASVNTGTLLDSPRAPSTVLPAVGDIVVKYTYTGGGGYNADVEATYHGEDTP